MRHLTRSLPPTLAAKPSSFLPTTFSTTTTTTSSSPPPESAATLSDQELSDLRRLLPSLCDSGHPLHAIRLLDTALLASPPLSSLPLPALADRLASLPTISPSVALLTALRFNPCRPSPVPFCSLLISSYFRRRRPREAAKIFAWLCRLDSPCRPDAGIYGTAVRGFCDGGRAAEAVRVVREMARDGVMPTEEIRVLVCLALLREARVEEGLGFDDAVGRGGIGEVKRVIDRIVEDWEE